MFKLFQGKKKTIEVVSPVTGKVVPLEDVQDQVFASKMMGEGVAFELTDDIIVSPTDGKITLLPESKHAFGVVSKEGLEILVHIGLDTVDLNGEGFTSLITVGDEVTKGTPIIEVDRTFIKNKGIILTTPMIVTNSSDFEVNIMDGGNDVHASSSVVLECTKK